MPDPPFDVAVANRFISSLSKSLQALCHGCMDFDSGIEIVGYINVNIDCGSKADYVLNEKVLKSTTNSMTFVSNSFLAKKDQPKQTRDGACSPIPQFSTVPYNRIRGFPHGSHGRSGYHGAYHRGAQKRGFSGDWRNANKRPRSMTEGRAPSAQYPSPVSAQGLHSETFSSDSFRQSSYQHQNDAISTNSGANGDAPTVNIKKETFEGSEEAQSSLENSCQQTNSGSSELVPSTLNIKSDPDGSSVLETEDNSGSKVEVSENNDFKGTFLQPTSKDNEDNADTAQASESEQTVGFETPFPNPVSPSETGGKETSGCANVTSESVSNVEAGGSEPGDKSVNDEATVEYDNATEESYSEYPDAGEGSSSGQFEVIEIDDEDEDMQAMFGASQESSSSVKEKPREIESSVTKPSLRESALLPTFKFHNCTKCTAKFMDGFSLQEHLHKIHNIIMAYNCTVCGKGYHTQSGLYYHMQSWHMKSVMCPVCDTKFARKSTFRTHLLRFHNMKQCLQCLQCIPYNEYAMHLLSCCRNPLQFS